MAIKAENWIGEATITEGNGPVSLSGALDGFAPFSVIDDESNVYYTIVDGASKETGIGTIHGRILTRTVIHATMVNGTYVKNGGPISLSGNAQVYGTVNAHMLQAFNELADKVGTQELTIAAINAVTINGTALTGNIQLDAAGVGARPYNWMPTAADVGADSAGSAAFAAQKAETCAKNYTDTTAVSKTDFDAFKTQHKTSNDQHTIAGVTGLQAALDSKEASGTVSSLVTPLADRVTALEARKSTCLVNATGTGAPHETVSAALPANIANNTRYVLTNPFGANVPVIGWAEVFYNNKWAQTGFVYDSESYKSVGVAFSYVQGEGIIIQTATGTLLSSSSSALTGSGHGKGSSAAVTSAPCRVFIQKLGA